MSIDSGKVNLFFRLRTLLLPLTFLAFGQTALKAPPLTAFQIDGYGQGTTYHITYYAPGRLVTQAQTDSLIAALDSSLSLYKPYSLINRFNNSARGTLTDQHLRRVVGKSLQIYRESGGLFDITVYPLVQLWGFGPVKTTALPDQAAIRAALQVVGSGKIHLRPDSLVKDLPGVKIDVNGIAQGYTVDLLAGLLAKRGIRNYMVELGGEIRVQGRKPDGSRLRIGIESPAETPYDEPVLQRIITLEQGAVTTSGNYRNYHAGGKKLSHLLDPRTGSPVRTELISVTVWAPDALTADGYDNALMGMSLPEALAFVRKHPPLEAYFIYHQPDGAVADTATAGFQKLFTGI